jgi:hypothetical protein
MVVFTFAVLGAAMLTQPAIAQIKEVRGLVHLRISTLGRSNRSTESVAFLNCRQQTRYCWKWKRLNDVNQANPSTVLER